MEIFLLTVVILMLLSGPAALILALKVRERVRKIEDAAARPEPRTAAPSGPPAAMPEPQREKPAALKRTPPLPPDAHRVEPAVSMPPRIEEAKPAPSSRAGSDAGQSSMEKFIGLKAMNWAGVVTSLFGVSLFLKVAYDKGWIDTLLTSAEVTGVIYLLGAALAGLGLFFRRKGHRLAGDGLCALGFGILYAASYCGHHVYGLFSSETAFILMSITTLCGVLVSVANRSQIVAGLIFLGAYLTPVLLSTGTDQGAFLTGYLVILGCGAMALNTLFRWTIVKATSLIATYILFSQWIFAFGETRISLGLTGTTLFFLLFSLALLLPDLIRKKEGRRDDAFALFTVALLSFGLFCRLLLEEHRFDLAAATLGMSVFFALQVVVFRLRDRTGSPAVVSGLILAIGFLLAAVPLRFGVWSMAVAWALEGTLLLALGLYRKNGLILLGSGAGYILSVVKLCDLLPLHTGEFSPVFNTPFGIWCLLAAAVCLASLFWKRLFLHEEESERQAAFRRSLSLIHAVAAATMVYFLAATEIVSHFVFNLGLPSHQAMPYVWLAGTVIFLVLVLLEKISRDSRYLAVSLTAQFVLLVSFLVSFARYQGDGTFPIFNPFFICGSVLVLAFVVSARLHSSHAVPRLGVYLWMKFILVLFLLLSAESYRIMLHHAGSYADGRLWADASLSVLWALFGAGLLITGIVRRTAWLRYIALSLFFITLAKVFLLDTASLEPLHRIIGFLTLGGVLIAGSFAYSRIMRDPDSALPGSPTLQEPGTRSSGPGA